MHDKMKPLLNAFLDGELHGSSLLEMKNHLSACPACQQELKELRLVSKELKSAAGPHFMPVERFIANLNLKLPRRIPGSQPVKPASLGWWLIPVGLLGTWLFISTAMTLISLVNVADSGNLLGSAGTWLDGSQQAFWYESVKGNLVSQPGWLESGVSVLNSVSVIGVNFLAGVLWQAGILVLYMGWLIVWWVRRDSAQIRLPVSVQQS